MQTFEHDDRTYEWCGGFGAIFKSRERGRSAGDVRMIGGELFYVYMLQDPESWFGPPLVCWSQPNPSIEHIRALQAHFFGVETHLLPSRGSD